MCLPARIAAAEETADRSLLVVADRPDREEFARPQPAPLDTVQLVQSPLALQIAHGVSAVEQHHEVARDRLTLGAQCHWIALGLERLHETRKRDTESEQH